MYFQSCKIVIVNICLKHFACIVHRRGKKNVINLYCRNFIIKKKFTKVILIYSITKDYGNYWIDFCLVLCATFLNIS